MKNLFSILIIFALLGPLSAQSAADVLYDDPSATPARDTIRPFEGTTLYSYSQTAKDISLQLVRTEPSKVTDNSAFNITLLVKNNGDVPYDLTAKFRDNAFFTTFASTTYYDINLQPSESYTMRSILVANDLILRENPLEVEFINNNKQEDYFIKQVDIEGNVANKYIDVSYHDYSQNLEDDSVSFMLTLNPSADLYDISLDLDISELPIMFEGNDNKFLLPEIKEPLHLPIKVNYDKNLVDSGIFNIPYTLKFMDAEGMQYSSSNLMPIKLEFDDKLTLGQVSSTPTKLVRDSKTNEITLEISNTGKDAVNDVIAKVRFEDDVFTPSYLGSDRNNLGYMDGSESTDSNFYFDISENANGDYDAYLELEYMHNSKEKSKSIPFNIHIVDAPYFEIRQESKTKSQDDEVRFFVKNIGDDAQDVEVVGLTRSLPISWDVKTDKVAKLEKGEEAEFVLKFSFTELAMEKEYAIPVRIRAVYNTEPLSQDETIYIESKGREVNLIPFIAVGLMLVGILILLGRYFFAKRKKGGDEKKGLLSKKD